MRNWKKLFGVCMAVCLLQIFPVQAEILVPPIPTAETEKGTTDTIKPPGGGGQPGLQAPGVQAPEVQVPGLQTPGVQTPGVQVPGLQTPTVQGPGMQLPGSQPQAGGQTTTPGKNQEVPKIKKPEIQAEGAVLMDAATGKVLYEKHADTKYFPASITKLMTALLVIENSKLDDTVTFSSTATTNLESGSVSLNIVEGDKLTVRQSLYALLLKSANEVANGLAEHVGGSNAGFAKMMNDRAKALGCTNTNFVNPHGLNDSNHQTTPRDMALIAREAFKNDTLRTIVSQLSYELPATKKSGARTITMGHKMMKPSNAEYYQGVIGGKTGYTSLAGNTLVTGAQRDGVRLIAVIMKSRSTHYTDTKALLDYGFQIMKGGGTAAPSGGKWGQDSTGWYYIKENGTRASKEWMTIDGQEYWFDPNAYMAVGWRQFSNGAWYYLRSSGAMAKNYWAKDGEKWFYLGVDGAMLKNTVTPDGYRLDGSGVWIT